ncbi:GrpE protein-like protein, mitochondrial [Golovinomyces cichoracearum]|uniref:GrpE protein homolog n=1 Tax=Golovinomyces cichoracearum TaxID=62708 RepID=A0A420ICM7_9PEZI|nr:GrpE protein-like protein, mitochondrial [Golovinomyces cichoracearum]
MIRRFLLRPNLAFRYNVSIRTSTSILQSSPPSYAWPSTRTWYSSESEPLKTEEKDEPAPSMTGEDPVTKELEAKKREIIDLKDKYVHSVADFRNLQMRTQRDMQAARDFAIQKFAKDLIESVDNLDRALTMVPQEKLSNPENSEDRKDLISLYEGLKMTEDILMNTLKKHGLERFDPSVEGEKFNPNEHEATFMLPVEEKEDNTVYLTQQKGFKLNGRVLRAAKVGVVKNTT